MQCNVEFCWWHTQNPSPTEQRQIKVSVQKLENHAESDSRRQNLSFLTHSWINIERNWSITNENVRSTSAIVNDNNDISFVASFTYVRPSTINLGIPKSSLVKVIPASQNLEVPRTLFMYSKKNLFVIGNTFKHIKSRVESDRYIRNDYILNFKRYAKEFNISILEEASTIKSEISQPQSDSAYSPSVGVPWQTEKRVTDSFLNNREKWTQHGCQKSSRNLLIMNLHTADLSTGAKSLTK